MQLPVYSVTAGWRSDLGGDTPSRYLANLYLTDNHYCILYLEAELSSQNFTLQLKPQFTLQPIWLIETFHAEVALERSTMSHATQPQTD